MLSNLKPQAPDKILMLVEEFKADTRQGKIDLGVGVYKDPQGVTPVMRAVKQAEQRIWENQTTKAYTGLAGTPEYREAMAGMVLGEVPAERLASVATVGGTGAIRQGLELARLANPDLTVYVSDPTWPNHLSILKFMGLPFVEYRYFDNDSRGVDFEAMKADIARAGRGDIVLLHGCCHNPTGANLTPEQWQEVVSILEQSGAVPLIDLAYQGFGDGLEADAEATRLVARSLPEVLIAASCSKNFGIYRERTGILMALAEGREARDLTQGSMAYLNRQNYSFPPDHGARIVSTILADAALRADWQAELEEVRNTMLGLRSQLASELRELSGSDRFDFIADHRGMFSRLGATPDQVQSLKSESAIYMVGDSRLNIAGLNGHTVPILARAIIEAGI
ncbi:MAG: amino acid aminotransferase [Paracoccus sp. (in: a-proteobacteria)]|jgi:aromatic-amino-acid transaminase|uniref:amino acid aminotransferase n=1 Tax=unclassified Paracoccus (in: a-proteobacteria) TaxID=2688777 RepID=UPI000C6A7029|nr:MULTISPECIES: amino acid aminotransferase [unclassified Paracoccus (in: a-proteobacteria)]MAN56103.1 aromatic amino acid aminotransferase [Paracoccus sp. (in: a-proteobacteria)]MBA50485.1 aromatic amino acid aminotransferase [Paracoccus sp. (in: a-proteobacteria)]HIC66967.1 aspartate/tyrosine/aromatic aminotransferase [Paracoccus sp. (in: a-proteobacteria)]|tara:strand:+ start:5312 stop:6493 length:1182 start_codon:yes stop_codon:yes gene_type:complete